MCASASAGTTRDISLKTLFLERIFLVCCLAPRLSTPCRKAKCCTGSLVLSKQKIIDNAFNTYLPNSHHPFNRDGYRSLFMKPNFSFLILDATEKLHFWTFSNQWVFPQNKVQKFSICHWKIAILQFSKLIYFNFYNVYIWIDLKICRIAGFHCKTAFL